MIWSRPNFDWPLGIGPKARRRLPDANLNVLLDPRRDAALHQCASLRNQQHDADDVGEHARQDKKAASQQDKKRIDQRIGRHTARVEIVANRDPTP